MTGAGERNSNNVIEIVLLGRTFAVAGLARQIEVSRPCIMKQHAASPATALH